jgi:hypothetical protein
MAAFGVLIEFVGFGTLAYDLIQTNRSTTRETVELNAEKFDAGRIVVFQADKPGEHSGVGIEDGLVGKLLDRIRSREDELRKQTAVILRGVVISAIGCALQVVGSFGQALQSCPPA